MQYVLDNEGFPEESTVVEIGSTVIITNVNNSGIENEVTRNELIGKEGIVQAVTDFESGDGEYFEVEIPDNESLSGFMFSLDNLEKV